MEGCDCDSRDHVEQFVGVCLMPDVVIDNAQIFAWKYSVNVTTGKCSEFMVMKGIFPWNEINYF